MSHPIYLPSATIQPGDTSYRATSPESSDPEEKDEGSDLELDDEAYAKKIEAELKLGSPSLAEHIAEWPVLVVKPVTVKEERDKQNAAHNFLRNRLDALNRGDRFRATNLYAPPAPTSQPTVSTLPLTGPSVPPQPAPGGASSREWAQYQHGSRHYALPAEPPMQSVRSPLDGGARVDSLIAGAIAADRGVAERARMGPLGGVAFGEHSRVDSSGHDTTGADSVSTVGQDTLPTRMP